jgi:transposase
MDIDRLLGSKSGNVWPAPTARVAAFCRLKDFRRVVTRDDKLAANLLSAVALATIIALWI